MGQEYRALNNLKDGIRLEESARRNFLRDFKANLYCGCACGDPFF
jgi:hypothetical protein